MHLQENDVLPIYLYWQDNKDCLGNAILLEHIKNGYPFIPTSSPTSTEAKTPVYNYER